MKTKNESVIIDCKFYDCEEDAEKYRGCYVLAADFKERTVRTNCGDFYYDYSISFDDFIKFADFIKKNDGRVNKRENRD